MSPTEQKAMSPTEQRAMSPTEQRALCPGGVDRLSGRVARLEARRRRTSELLRRQTDFAAAVLDATTDLILELDAGGRIVRLNRACRELTGYSLDDVRGRRPWEFLVPPEEADQLRRACVDAPCGAAARPLHGSPAAAPPRHEGLWLDKDGGRWRIAWSCTPLADAAGRVRSMVITAADRTGRREYSAVSEQRLNSLLRLTQTACELSEQEIVELTLEEAVRLTQSKAGYVHFVDPARQVIETFAWSPPATAPAVAASLPPRAVSQAGRWADSIRLKCPVMHNAAGRLIDDQGCLPAGRPLTRHLGVPVLEVDDVVMVMGVCNKEAPYSLSDERQLLLMGDQLWKLFRRKRSERMLRESEERYRTVVETSPDAIVLVSAEGRFLTANRQFFHMSGYASLHEIEEAGLHVFDFFAPDDAQRAKDEFHRVLADGMGSNDEYLLRRRDGSTYYAEITCSVVRNAQGEPAALMAWVHDMTHRRGLEVELREHVRALEEEDRHKDEFLAMLAHELRNPLASICSAVDVLSLPQAPAAAVQHSRDVMRHQLEHLVRLVDDLLDVSRITRGKIELRCEVIDLVGVLCNAMEISRALIESRGHRLTLRKPAAAVYVHGDPIRLAQVVANLLNNAAKYTPEHGQIWLTLGVQQGQAVVRVRDTGLGISAQSLPRIWEPFVQGHTSLHRAQGGLGLGLTLVRHLVELHGGSVEVLSQGLNRGSEFVVRLPLSTRPAAVAPAKASRPDSPAACPTTAPPAAQVLAVQAPAVQGPVAQAPAVVDAPRPQSAPAAAMRVLVVDDNADAATLLSVLLTEYGYEVQTVGDGAAALDTARSFRPQAVLLDIGLPGMDGYEVARHLREEHPASEMLLVAVSGYGHAEARRRSQEVGIDHHLVKPVNPQRLLKLLTPRPDGTRPAKPR